MASGGARKRSGPAKNPESERSIRAGYSLTALPAEGYSGAVPDFPLSRRFVMRWETEGKARFQVRDDDATAIAAERELALWEWAWSTPQACAWSMPKFSYLLMTIAMYVRTLAICESSEATAADKNSLHRFADEIGMTSAGLAAMGWSIATDEVAEKRAQKEPAVESASGSRGRVTVVKANG